MAYDAYGNQTSSAPAVNLNTASTYDLADRLTSITPPATSATTFTFDALGRFLTRVTPAGSDAYEYVGASETAWRITSGGVSTSSALDPSGARIASAKSGTSGYLLPDLHGNLAAVVNSAETALLSSTRYDAFGQTAAAYDSGGSFPTPWRFQGRLDVSPTAEPLYDFSARFYDPAIGAFTQLDTYAGSAGDPLSLNRFAYAAANPWTLIDPSGHFPCSDEECTKGIATPVKSSDSLPPAVQPSATTVELAPALGEIATPDQIAVMSVGELHAYAISREKACAGFGYWGNPCADYGLAVCTWANAMSGGNTDCGGYVMPRDWSDIDGPLGTFVVAPAVALGAQWLIPAALRYYQQHPEQLDKAALVARNYAQGRAFQERVLSALRLKENFQNVASAVGNRVKLDSIFGRGLLEVKSGGYVYANPQMRGMLELAERAKLPFDLVIGPGTKVSGPLQRLILQNPFGGSIWRFDPGSGFWSQVLGGGFP